MDQHGEKEAENKSSQDSAGQRQDDDAEESVGQRAGYKAEESAGLLIKEVSSGEASPALIAHPCSLLQLLLRACAGCLGLHGYCSGDPDPKPVVVAAADAAAAASQEGEGGGDKANEEVVTRVWAVRRPRRGAVAMAEYTTRRAASPSVYLQHV
ncbi:hypothetical protein PVAP13_7NG411600 [Panicum virgatum]|uniref:Uncharacterized protein n=1 Tax=Panicum virgatum TaxID=38727 RepID=A0A8T0Q2L0_PANVG|nr:hypothetical protein PVAP13_7NG411600 [Panicum virgatum]